MDEPRTEILKVRCCVVGGGPAGMMVGFLLARSGIEVVVLEKHGDFFRDFRGDTIHPSTLEVMAELGFLDEFLQLPHQRLSVGAASIGGVMTPLADLTGLPTRCRFIAIMPQWDFLNFLADKAKGFPHFRLRMKSEATDLLWKNGGVSGVTARGPEGDLHVECDLVIGADGRRSIVREKAGFKATDFGAPIDVLWMRVAKKGEAPEQTLGYINQGKFMVLINRGDYFQVGYVIPKGAFEGIQAQGLERLRADLAGLAPFLKDGLEGLKDWNEVKLLTVKIDRLPRWHRAGLLCIGDSAHAMSPAGGVGVNYAVQDAVAAANLLAGPLLSGPPELSQLAQVQARREFPVRFVQRLQLFAHRRVNLGNRAGPTDANALPLRIVRRFPAVRRMMGRLIGLGLRPEHVRTEAAQGKPPEHEAFRRREWADLPPVQGRT